MGRGLRRRAAPGPGCHREPGAGDSPRWLDRAARTHREAGARHRSDRAGCRCPLRPSHPTRDGRHRHRHLQTTGSATQSAAAGHSTRTRECRVSPPGQYTDRALKGLVVAFNASNESTTQTVAATAGRRYGLHAVQASRSPTRSSNRQPTLREPDNLPFRLAQSLSSHSDSPQRGSRCPPGHRLPEAPSTEVAKPRNVRHYRAPQRRLS